MMLVALDTENVLTYRFYLYRVRVTREYFQTFALLRSAVAGAVHDQTLAESFVHPDDHVVDQTARLSHARLFVRWFRWIVSKTTSEPLTSTLMPRCNF